MKKGYLWLVKSAFRSLRHPQLRHRKWWRALTRPISNRLFWIPCRDTVATGLSIGVFFSMMLMPFQMVPAFLLAMRAKANIPFAMAGCWVSNPLTLPFIIWWQFRLGEWLRHSWGVPMPKFIAKVSFTVEAIGELNAASFILGMISSAVLLSLAVYPAVHAFSALLPQYLPVRRNLAERRILTQRR